MTTLLDSVTTGQRAGWGTEDRTPRECAVTLELIADVCAPTGVTLVQGGGGKYEISPVGLLGTLDRSTNCTEDDDASWLTDATRNALELAVAGALITQPAGGADAGIWAGHPDVNVATGTYDAAGIGAARSDWYRHAAWKDKKVRPVLHLPPADAPEMKAAGLLIASPGKDVETIWGDEVIMSPVYDWAGGGFALWTGPLSVDVSSVENTGTQISRQNRATTAATLLLTIDTPPCAIVLVGTLPAGGVPEPL
jgi:hypothetical protein